MTLDLFADLIRPGHSGETGETGENSHGASFSGWRSIGESGEKAANPPDVDAEIRHHSPPVRHPQKRTEGRSSPDSPLSPPLSSDVVAEGWPLDPNSGRPYCPTSCIDPATITDLIREIDWHIGNRAPASMRDQLSDLRRRGPVAHLPARLDALLELLPEVAAPSCRTCANLRRPGLTDGYCAAREDLPLAYGERHPLHALPADGGASCSCWVDLLPALQTA